MPNLQLQKIDQKAEKERDHETEKERQTGCFLTADFFCAASTKLETLLCGTEEEMTLRSPP